MLCFLQASLTAFTTSPLPSIQGLFFTECSVYLLGHKQNPSWCLQVKISPFKPASFITATHCSASKAVGLKTSGLSSPKPHSLSVKVLVVKCTNAYCDQGKHAVNHQSIESMHALLLLFDFGLHSISHIV